MGTSRNVLVYYTERFHYREPGDILGQVRVEEFL